MRDQFNNINPIIAVAPVQVSDNTAQVGAIIDTLGYDALTFVVAAGTLADPDATFTLLIEHGDQADLSDAAEVPDTELLGTEALASLAAAADDDTTKKIGYAGYKRYVRPTLTPAANTGAADLAVLAILGRPTAAPTPNPPA